MNEYIKGAVANQYARAAIVGLATGIAMTTPYIQSKVSAALGKAPGLERKVETPLTTQKLYKIMCPEGFTPLKWTIGEGLNSDSVKAKEVYEDLNGEGHIPQPGRSALYLFDYNKDGVIAGVKVTPADEANVQEWNEIIDKRTKRYNRQ